MNLTILTISLTLLTLTALPAAADFYRYTDSKGELHFVDDISKVPKKYRKQLQNAGEEGNVNVVDAAPAAPVQKVQADEAAPPSRQVRANTSTKVEVYMTSWCGYCKKMVRFLNEKGIPYTAYDIEKDSAAAHTYKELGGRGVPVVRVGSRVIHGYSPEAVMAYYSGAN